MSEDADLTIHKLSNDYQVPEYHPNPESVRRRLDEIAGRKIPEQLEKALARWFESDSEGIYLIRRLHCDVDLDCDFDSETLSRRWAARIAGELFQKIKSTDGILYFSGYSEYLARFLQDLAAGRAWDRWFYRRYEGLKSLPVPIALRTAIMEKPEAGLKALLGMNGRERLGVIDALGTVESKRLLETWSAFQETETADLTAAMEAVVESLKRDSMPFYGIGSPWPAALEMYLRIAESHLLSGVLLECLCAVFLLRQTAFRPIVPAVVDADLETIRRESSPDRAASLVHLLRLPYMQRRKIAEITDPLTTPSSYGKEVFEIRHTAFGGIFFLLPRLDEILPHGFVEEWSVFADSGREMKDSVPALVMLLTVAKIAGNENFGRIFHDPLVRDMLLIPPLWSLGSAAEFSRRVPLEHWFELLRRIGSRRLEYRPERLNRALLRQQNEVSTLFFEAGRRVCVYGENRRLKSDPGWLTGHLIGNDVTERDKTESVGAYELYRDFAFLRGNLTGEFEPGADFALNLVAQGILRDFSNRLTGFAHASLAGIFRDFLSFTAGVQATDAEYKITLGRPPLDVVLNMTGLQRERYRLTVNPKKEFRLFPEQ
ncbi:MAG: hypothetical protein ACU833_05210 [Gammaproteobacteria bacterium]